MLKHAYDGEGHSSEFRTQSLKLDSLVRFFITIHLWNRSLLFRACQSRNLQDLTSSNRASLMANMGLVLGDPIPDYCHFLCPLTLPGSSQGWKIPEEGRSTNLSSSWDKWALYMYLPVYMVAVQGLVPLPWCFNYSQVKHLQSQFATCGSVWQDHLFCCFLITTQMSLNLTQMFSNRTKYCLDCCC